MLMSKRMRKEEAPLDIDELIDEEVQFGEEILINFQSEKEFKGKKLQVGGSRLGSDFEVSCQTGHIIMESGCQTDEYDQDEDVIDSTYLKEEEQLNMYAVREFSEKEIQSDDRSIKRPIASKKVQAGYSQLIETIDTACQSEVVIKDSEVQTEMEEILVIDNRTRKEEASLEIYDLINEEVQYCDSNATDIKSEKEFKGKKLQVGSSKLGCDFDVSCQTGHIVTDTKSQTEKYWQEEVIDTHLVQKEQLNPVLIDKVFVEQEVQSENLSQLILFKSIKVQVGYPNVNESTEIGCQSNNYYDDAQVQTEVDEMMIIVSQTEIVNAELLDQDMIDEVVQYNDDNIMTKEYKGKKLQVGNSRLDADFDASCQTGHIVVDSESQTEELTSQEEIVDAYFIEAEEETMMLNAKDFVEREVQSEEIRSLIAVHSKGTQFGFPLINESREFGCQSKINVKNSEIQTEIEETLVKIKQVKKVEMPSLIEDMIDEEIQCGEDIIIPKEFKGKKLQVGNSRLDADFDASCQTGHLITTSETQTEEQIAREELVNAHFVDAEEETRLLIDKIFVEKEVHMEDVSSFLVTKSKTIQVGFPHVNQSVEFGCQAMVLVEDEEIQTEIEEMMIIVSKVKNSEAAHSNEIMIEEEVQYGEDRIIPKQFKAKKLQVGNSRLDLDYEVSCQTGHIVMDSHCQTTEELREEIIDSYFVEEQERENVVDKVLIEMEVQSEEILKSTRSLHIQVGYSRIDESIEIGCQSKVIVDDAEVQTEVEETMIRVSHTKKVEEALSNEFMIDEEIQYGDEIYRTKVYKGKKLQVGNARLDLDSEKSCQTGHSDKDSQCQTEGEYMQEKIIDTYSRQDKEEMINVIEKEFIEREVQSEKVSFKSSNVQVGYPIVNEFLEVECQSKVSVENAKVQTEINEKMVMINRLKKEKVEKMSNEEVQYNKNSQDKDIMLQVGNGDINNERDESSIIDDSGFVTLRSKGSDSVKADIQKSAVDQESQYDITLSINIRSTQTDNPERTNLTNQICQYSIDDFKNDFVDSAMKSVESQYIIDRQMSLEKEVQTREYLPSHSVSLQIAPKVHKFDQSAHLLLNYFDKQVSIDTNSYEIEKGDVEYDTVDVQHYSKMTLLDRQIQHRPHETTYLNKLTTVDLRIDYMIFSDQFNSQVELHDRLISYSPRKRTLDQVFEFDGVSNCNLTDLDHIPKYITKDNIRLFESIATQVYEDEIIVKPMLASKLNQETSDKPKTSVESHSVSLAPKLIHRNKRMISDGMSTDIMTIEEARSKKRMHSAITETETVKMVNEEVMFEETKKETMEFSIDHDTLIFEESQQATERSVEQSELEFYQVSLPAKLIDDRVHAKMNSLATEVSFVTESSFISLTPKSLSHTEIQYDDKMTCTPEFVEKCTLGTQVYIAKMYNGESQTSISTANYGVQVTDFDSLPSTPSLSPIPTNTYGYSSKMSLKTNDNYVDACLDVSFEEDYIFESVKSRSIVTTKQEILPKLSHDFVDSKEESPNLLSPRKLLCSTKTQSISDSNFDASNQIDDDDKQLLSIYKRMLESRCVKEQGVQGTNVECLFEIILKEKGAQYIIGKYQKIANVKTTECQTENMLVNSVKTQYYPDNVKSLSTQTIQSTQSETEIHHTISLEKETTASIISSSAYRPAHRNMRIQRGCSYFKMMDVSTNTEDGLGDHIEVTYTETILEESIITKRPRSKIETLSDDNAIYSRSSSFNRASSTSTPIPVSSQNTRHTQTAVIPKSQIFVEQDKCDLFLTFARTYQVTAVYDYVSTRYVSLIEAIESNIINVEEDSYKISNTKFATIENAMKERFIR